MVSLIFSYLTHWGRDKMAAISQTTFSNVFSWMKTYEFRLRFHWHSFWIHNIPSLVQIMAWRRPGDKPLSEPMMVNLLMHRCVTWPHWPALRAGLLCCNFFGQPGSVSKFPPLLWVKLWVGWVGRGYTEISRYFPASWINWVTLVTKIKLLYSLRF